MCNSDKIPAKTKSLRELKQIDLIRIKNAMWKHKMLFLISIPIAFILSAFIIVSVPRYYKSTVKLAPELSNMSTSSLNSIASSFGIDLGGTNNSADAIFPELYPDLIASVDFKTSMFSVMVETQDHKVKTNLYDYLKYHQKGTWWDAIFDSIKSIFKKKKAGDPANSKVNPFRLTQEQDMIAQFIGDKIVCAVDKKNFVISITATDQDPLVSATVAEAAKEKLQDFITQYRTRKAQKELDYNIELRRQAKEKYDKARLAYASYSDANSEVILESVKSKLENLENEMQLQFNTYAQLTPQVQAARAKVIEQTPAFTPLQSATVPLKPAGPKRMIFVATITMLVFAFDTIFACIKSY